jgi:uncharacterized protein YbjT (DUF2867 family)
MVSKKKLLITSAFENEGKATVQYACDHYLSDYDIYAGMNSEEAEELRHGVLDSYATSVVLLFIPTKANVTEYLDNIDVLFIIPPRNEKKLEVVKKYIDAAVECGVRFVLLLSLIKADDRSYVYGRQFHDMELYLVKSSIHHFAVIRAGYYFENLFYLKDELLQNTLPLPTGDGRFAPVALNDVAAMVCKVIEDYQTLSGKIYNITGPHSMNGFEIAEVISLAIHRDISFVNCKIIDVENHLQSKLPLSEVEGLLEFYEFVFADRMNVISHDYEDITGEKMTMLYDFARNNLIHLE